MGAGLITKISTGQDYQHPLVSDVSNKEYGFEY